jgi:hypothetical protein
MPGILWLASYPKSGNTWLRAFLANLFRNPPRPIPIDELPQHAIGDNFLIHYEQYTGRPRADLSDEELNALRPKVHDWIAEARADTVLMKTHNILGKVGDVPLITPSATAGAVYVVRNPLDLAVSYASHYQVSIDRAIELLGDTDNVLPPTEDQLPQYLSTWSRHVLTWIDAPGLKVHVMRYEDMHAEPFKAFGGLVAFLGLPKDMPRLKKALEFSRFEELSAQEEGGGFIEARPDRKARFFREGKVGGWRDVLTEAQVAQIVADHGPVMRRLEYLTDDGRIVV